VESQKTVIEYNGGPASPGPHRVLYTGVQDSGPLCRGKPSPERSTTPSSRTTHGGGPEGWRATRRFLPIGYARAGTGGRPGSNWALAGREARLRLGAVQVISKGSPRHTTPPLPSPPSFALCGLHGLPPGRNHSASFPPIGPKRRGLPQSRAAPM
jgi:hypothetical protein